ncbi:pseudouridine synthase [Paracoccus sp. M683]|uniref:pseudouridine synthase n=1 Tax=Paracoccus sp. M683 TaxID=2594268 RepID=UPI00117F8A2C|nr:pseudouridine synthase [Paracoccus sp. M683]TRW97611.1 pseudouridine synthase [Paracoccus sp. M683]
MTDTPHSPNPEKPAEADRIAKVIARAGVASRRDAERMIIEGRVTVNGEKIASPALDVLPSDKIKVDGKPLDAPQETRLWMYYKPLGLVTSESDEKGRQTVFDALPRDLPRVMSVGRLDLNSEGLLLLTNDGELKRRLELPSTGWLRRYRVRVNGNPTDLTFDPLRRGVSIEGEDFQPMEVRLDSQQGANAWLTVGIREGRNREIRRAMAHVGMQVNRLIRIGYGPFKLTGMEENEVREVKRRTLRDQLGGLLTGEVEDKPREFRERGADRDGPREHRKFGDRDDDGRGRDDRGGERGPRPARFAGADDGRKPFRRREDGDGPRPFRSRDGERDDSRDDRGRKPFGGGSRGAGGFGKDDDRKPRWSSRPRDAGDGERPERASGGGKPFARRDGGKPYGNRDGGKPYGNRDGGKPFARRDGDKPYSRRDGDDAAARSASGYKPRGENFKSRDEGFKPRNAGGFKSRDDGGSPRSEGYKPRGEGFKSRDDGFKPRNAGGFKSRDEGGKPRGEGFKPRSEGFKPGGPRKGGQPGGGKPFAGKGGRPGGGRPGGGKPRAPRG